MKNKATLLAASVLLAFIFIFMIFSFQVRQTQVAVVTTFGRYSRSITEPGLYGRLPWPIQTIYRLDKRVQDFDKKFEQTTTHDGRNLMISVYVGWRIQDPRLFIERFSQGDLARAEQTLEGIVRDVKNGVVGTHDFGDFISTHEKDLKLDAMEREMLAAIQPLAKSNYGIQVDFLGIKQLGLPESITAKVMERMRKEREQLVKQFKGEGEGEAIRIRAEADRERSETLAKADAQATRIRGQADAEAAKYYAVFEKNPDLANFLIELNALELSLKERTTLVIDQQTIPFNLLKNPNPTRSSEGTPK